MSGNTPRFKIRKGMILFDTQNGREVKVASKAKPEPYWMLICGRRGHKTHEGTIHRFFKPVKKAKG